MGAQELSSVNKLSWELIKNVFKQRNSGSSYVKVGNFSPLRYQVTRLNGVRTKQMPSIITHSFSDIDGRLKSIFPSSQSRQLVSAMSGNCRLYCFYYLLVIITNKDQNSNPNVLTVSFAGHPPLTMSDCWLSVG
jgi:hypothetical protein